jgi:outer membrane protein TolC
VAQSQSRGLNYGFSASLNLFDGFAQNRNEKNAKIQIENSKLNIDQQSFKCAVSLYQTYVTNLELIALEEKKRNYSQTKFEYYFR